MKPEDVMRALECCITKHHENCCQLGTWSEEWNCMTDLMKKALALLREKDARIKELEEAQGAEFTCFVGDPHKVDHCPYGDEIVRLQKDVAEKDEALEDAYDYIRRLEAVKKIRDEEISEHQKKIEQLQIATMKKDAEIERLSSRVSILHEIELSYALQYGDAIDKDIARRQLRADAITEFAERAKRRLPIVSPSVFDKIAKEMKGI